MPLSSRREAKHGLDNRGLEAGALPGAGYGRFGRMFDASGPSLPDECLQAIAEAMVTDDPGKPIDVPDPTDENPTIPAGYTYFGQFIDHDITFDPTPLAARQVDVAALQDFRTPALDLDCVYGRGPDDQPFMYKEDGLQLREGVPLTPTEVPVATKNDVPRLKIDGQFTQPAILGDKRNDENRLVAQLHSVFIAFHNKVVNDRALVAAGDGAWADDTSRFRSAVNIVRWHYQWLVLNDFLPKVLYPGVLHRILNPDGAPRLDHYDKPAATYAYIPVEFAGAAYRFGHSMVRPSYALNLNVGTGSDSPSLGGGGPGQPRIPIFTTPDQSISPQENARRNLNGLGVPMPSDWGIDWAFFLDGLDRSHICAGMQVPQPSYRIDANLAQPLRQLPEFAGQDTWVQHLAYRNLARGVANLCLPSGEQVAKALGEEPLSADVLWSAGSALPRSTDLDSEAQEDLEKARKRRLKVKTAWVDNHGPLEGNTPLWYYILREAEYCGTQAKDEGPTAAFGGQHLGPVGSRIVAETFVGLLSRDRNSYLNRWPRFRPFPPIAGADGNFSLARLITYAVGG